jgi:acetyl-CoA carboxylase, biotin carboxylase subunit
MFRKVLIANRGEIAVRLIRACRDLGISPVAVYSEPDRDALHVKLSDEAYLIGPASSAESYLRVDRILDACRKASAEALHPGYGFLAESEQLVRACEETGIAFIGPSHDSTRMMATKLGSRRAAQAAGIPVVPGSPASLASPEAALEAAEALGFPILLKADSGGGGKGMRVVGSAPEMAAALEGASNEAKAAFGDPSVYLERYLDRPRHIEIQILGDQQGNVIYLGERECSVQRRHQKIIEESPSPLADENLREALGAAALRLAHRVGYYSAGTIEFLVDSADPRNYYFLEMNTRLQVEHPVTEIVTGIDIVCEQIRVAAGERLGYRQEDVALRGAAIECRVYAEDPANNFFPAPGKITELSEPAGPGIRNDSALYPGYEIPIHYDPLISKLISFGQDRDQALRRMLRALGEYRVGGVPTSVSFLKRLISHPEFVAGRLHNRFLEDHGLLEPEGGSDGLEVPLLAAAVCASVENEQARGPAQSSVRGSTSWWKQSARPGTYGPRGRA